MQLWLLIHRVILIALPACASVFLAARLGAWAAAAVWSLGMLIACCVTGLLLSRQPVGTHNAINALAGWLLMWGWRLTQGALARMVAVSWLVWVLLGVGAIALAVAGEPDGLSNSSLGLRGLLYLIWLILGWGVLYLLGVMVSNRRVNPPLVVPTLILVGLIAGSAAMYFRAPSRGTLISAVLLAGGPIVVIGVGYGLFMVVLLIAGRKTRWR